MHLNTRGDRTIALWIALLLAICNAMAPPLLRIAAVARGEAVVEVCTAFGVKHVGADSHSGPVTPTPWDDAAACKFCLGSQSPCAPAYDHPVLLAGAPVLDAGPLPDSPVPHNPARFSSRPRAPPPVA